MAQKATVFKAQVELADMERHQYLSQSLTLARHPSETNGRLMVRMLAWCMYGDERLEFTKGLCADDEPELWLKNDAGEIELWIELGQPDEKRLKKACSRAKQVVLFNYGQRSADVWWQQNQGKLGQLKNLTIWSITDEEFDALAELAARGIKLQANIMDGQVMLSTETGTAAIEPSCRQRA
ncbi:YaeQ family protein [Ferrimonas aestuarii]|uniref:YaeQ family protein n=1 Tax=Ferrimonas aestuarii TaxID=2569539 RepID=A0A4V6WMQ3_9GAMM|nr:YaeQ family protein [Ferrimonas aestuarii]TKB50765.1 YaeQ family protein [Ferrimonas aestuarii]